MRLMRSLTAGVFALAAFGGMSAYAQDGTRGYWVNPALSGEILTSNTSDSQQANSSDEDDFALGFTLNGFAGITGELELGRVTIDPSATDERIAAFGHSGIGGAVDEAVGEASMNVNITDRLQFSSTYAREEADPTLFDGSAVFEDEFSGEFSYSITPRFAVSALGARSVGAETDGGTENFTGDRAAVNAEYRFLPYVSGSVNYTYQSYDGQEGVLSHDESTVSLSLTGRF